MFVMSLDLQAGYPDARLNKGGLGNEYMNNFFIFVTCTGRIYTKMKICF